MPCSESGRMPRRLSNHPEAMEFCPPLQTTLWACISLHTAKLFDRLKKKIPRLWLNHRNPRPRMAEGRHWKKTVEHNHLEGTSHTFAKPTTSNTHITLHDSRMPSVTKEPTSIHFIELRSFHLQLPKEMYAKYSLLGCKRESTKQRRCDKKKT